MQANAVQPGLNTGSGISVLATSASRTANISNVSGDREEREGPLPDDALEPLAARLAWCPLGSRPLAFERFAMSIANEP